MIQHLNHEQMTALSEKLTISILSLSDYTYLDFYMSEVAWKRCPIYCTLSRVLLFIKAVKPPAVVI